MMNTTSKILAPGLMANGPDNFYWGGGPGWGGGFGFFGLFWIIFFILGLLLCVWIYRDANSRGMNGILWVLAILVGSLFWLGWLVVLIIYLVVRGSAHGRPLI
jgi:putative membrane protein